MSALLARVGRFAAIHPWRVIAAWIAAAIIVFGAVAAFDGETHDDYSIDGVAGQIGTDLLIERFPNSAGADARVVIHNLDGTVDRTVIAEVSKRLRAIPEVARVEFPRTSADGSTTLIAVTYKVPVTDFKGSEGVDALWDAATPATERGLHVAFGGQVPENITSPSGVAEAVGIAFALLILLFAFGSVIAAGLPIAVALLGVGTGTGLIMILAGFTTISMLAPTIATMVGIGVGIDYALLLVTRYVEGLRDGMDVPDAVAHANSTAGESVLFAGTTVLVSLLGLRLSGTPMFESFGYATFLMVGVVMLISVTVVPALCALAGTRVLSKKGRLGLRTNGGADANGGADFANTDSEPPRKTLTHRWAIRVSRRPVLWMLGSLGILLLLAAPVLDMRTWPQDAGSQPESNTVRQAYDLIDDGFGPGANGPLVLAIDLEQLPPRELSALSETLKADPDIANVFPVIVNAESTAALIVAEPTTGPSDPASTELIDRLRSELPDGVHITGLTAMFVDISDLLAQRLWLVIAFVVLVSVVLLTIVFRAPLVAFKAAIMNLLSVAAAYGVLVMIFQWGWGAELLGLPHAIPVSSWVPILLFTILFGLSMDYEVFLLSRVRERWLITGDPHSSVVEGLASTGRVVTCAAAIMIAVFSGFALDPDVTVKMMGVGLATAVLIDATIVRMILVPSTMYILGSANWWLPARLRHFNQPATPASVPSS